MVVEDGHVFYNPQSLCAVNTAYAAVVVTLQAAQRTLRSNSSSSNIPGSASKLRVLIPQTTRVDGEVTLLAALTTAGFA
jgi:hypothetical protein